MAPLRVDAARATTSAGDLIAERVSARESQIVLGLDPDPMDLWPDPEAAAQGAPDGPPVPPPPVVERELAVARAVLRHCRALIDAAGPACVAVKPQLACFERLGPAGWWILGEVIAHSRARGLLTIADGKRGDISVSAAAYAQALTCGAASPEGPVGGLRADLATANPLMGRDALGPLVASARACGAGLFVLVRTSNPGAADVADLPLRDGGVLWERLAAIVAELGEEGVGEGGISDIGAVMGATAPAHLERARELMPHACFLLPGIGAQGGRVEDLAPAFAPGRAGGLVSASRSIAGAHRSSDATPAAAARAEAERLRGLAWSLI